MLSLLSLFRKCQFFLGISVPKILGGTCILFSLPYLFDKHALLHPTRTIIIFSRNSGMNFLQLKSCFSLPLPVWCLALAPFSGRIALGIAPWTGLVQQFSSKSKFYVPLAPILPREALTRPFHRLFGLHCGFSNSRSLSVVASRLGQASNKHSLTRFSSCLLTTR